MAKETQPRTNAEMIPALRKLAKVVEVSIKDKADYYLLRTLQAEIERRERLEDTKKEFGQS